MVRENDRYILRAPNGKLYGATIILKKPSVTATETLMMAAILAVGETVIKNAAREPEISALANFLNACGANVRGAGESEIHIIGGDTLTMGENIFHTPPDRIEAGSFLILGALAGKKFEIKNCEPLHMQGIIDILRRMGVAMDVGKDSIVLLENSHPSLLSKARIKTREYPGFPTDLQAPMTVLLTQTKGESHVHETIFEGRLAYTDELLRMGADIEMRSPSRAVVRGPRALVGQELRSPDLRAGLAFIIAAIVAKGRSVIHNVYNIDRGYERIEERLRGVGVNIKRVK